RRSSDLRDRLPVGKQQGHVEDGPFRIERNRVRPHRVDIDLPGADHLQMHFLVAEGPGVEELIGEFVAKLRLEIVGETLGHLEIKADSGILSRDPQRQFLGARRQECRGERRNSNKRGDRSEERHGSSPCCKYRGRIRRLVRSDPWSMLLYSVRKLSRSMSRSSVTPNPGASGTCSRPSRISGAERKS